MEIQRPANYKLSYNWIYKKINDFYYFNFLFKLTFTWIYFNFPNTGN